VRILGDETQRWLGVEACALGDVDGDGRGDIAASWREGAAELGGLTIHSSADGRRLVSIDGADLGLRLGAELGTLGDFDGDDIADVAVLAQDKDVWETHGTLPRFVVLSGADGHELACAVDESGIKRREVGLFSVGDLDRDGSTDIALFGAQGAVGAPPAFVNVYSGKDLRTVLRLEGNAQQCDFGRSVAAAGDVDGDGTNDLLIAFPRNSFRTGDEFPTCVQVVSGANGHAIWEYHADSPDRSGMGRALSSAADVDEDGLADFLIASDDLERSVWLCSGATGEVMWRWIGDKDEWDFGDVIASLGDLDGDCARDVAVARGNWSQPDLFGRVKLYSSRSGALLGALELASLEAQWAERATPQNPHVKR
jgi:hypothetical protein